MHGEFSLYRGHFLMILEYFYSSVKKNEISQSYRLDPKQIVHKVENKLKELHEERFWSEISKSSRLCYLYSIRLLIKRIQNGTIC